MAFSVAMPARTDLGGVADEIDDLCARAARGEREAILALYREHHAHVRAFARRLLNDDSLAEDLVHEVFMNLPRALGRFRGECSMRSYLVAVAARRAHHQIRAAARRRAFEMRFSREPARPPRTPDVEAEREELARVLAVAVERLPVEQRIAFVLCEVEERTSTEVGAMLGEKDTTIRARVFHAKNKLREALAGALAPPALSLVEAAPAPSRQTKKRETP
jgi:RNA polymerase sigma-70 factor (ECF subfamily)